MGILGSDVPDDHGQDMEEWVGRPAIPAIPPSGFDRTQDAMREYLFPKMPPVVTKASPPVEPLVRVVIGMLYPMLFVTDRIAIRKHYRVCRRDYNLTRGSARRAVAVQIVVVFASR